MSQPSSIERLETIDFRKVGAWVQKHGKIILTLNECEDSTNIDLEKNHLLDLSQMLLHL
jgi:hypothetical protein